MCYCKYYAECTCHSVGLYYLSCVVADIAQSVSVILHYVSLEMCVIANTMQSVLVIPWANTI